MIVTILSLLLNKITCAVLAVFLARIFTVQGNTQQVLANSDLSKLPTTSKMSSDGKVNVLMVGTGEYTTGYVGGKAADSDKGAGVVALTMFDLRRRAKVERVGMCGVNVSLL